MKFEVEGKEYTLQGIKDYFPQASSNCLEEVYGDERLDQEDVMPAKEGCEWEESCADEESIEEGRQALGNIEENRLVRTEKPIFALIPFIHPMAHSDVAWADHKNLGKRYD